MTQVGTVTPVGSARFDGDTWDLASSVGLTATMVAAARAVAGRAPDPLIDDQFAAPPVPAVGVDHFARMAGGELDSGELDEDGSMRRFAAPGSRLATEGLLDINEPNQKRAAAATPRSAGPTGGPDTASSSIWRALCISTCISTTAPMPRPT